MNNKVYIGQTWEGIRRRLKRHCAPSATSCVKLHCALNKYGRENFSIQLLTVCYTQSVSDYWELYFIKQYDSIHNGYNLREGGDAGKLPVSTRKKMSLARLGKKRSETDRRKISEGRKGMKFAEEHRKNLSIAASNITDEQKISKGKAHKGKTWKVIDGKRVWIIPIYQEAL